MNTVRLLRLAAFLMASFGAKGVDASDVQAMLEWKNECVGRMQIRVPGDVEFAALMPMGLQQEIKGAASESAYVFGDGERASKTRFDYGGVLFITHELDKNTQLQFRRSASKRLNEMSDIVNKKHRRNEDGTPMAFENLQMAGNGAIGWRVNSLFTAYMDVGKSSILLKVRGRPEDMAATRRAYNFLIAGTIKARGKKIAPIDEKIFLKIAEGVAASVKRRPTR